MPLTMRGTPRMPSDRLYKTDAPIMRRGPPRALSSISLPHNSSDSVRQAPDAGPASLPLSTSAESSLTRKDSRTALITRPPRAPKYSTSASRRSVIPVDQRHGSPPSTAASTSRTLPAQTVKPTGFASLLTLAANATDEDAQRCTMCRISHIPGRPDLDGARVVALENSDSWAHELPRPANDELAVMLQRAKADTPQTLLVKKHQVMPHTVAQLIMDVRTGQAVMTSPRRREHVDHCLRGHRDRSYTSNVIGAPFSTAYERIGLDNESAWWRKPSVVADVSLDLSVSHCPFNP